MSGHLCSAAVPVSKQIADCLPFLVSADSRSTRSVLQLWQKDADSIRSLTVTVATQVWWHYMLQRCSTAISLIALDFRCFHMFPSVQMCPNCSRTHMADRLLKVFMACCSFFFGTCKSSASAKSQVSGYVCKAKLLSEHRVGFEYARRSEHVPTDMLQPNHQFFTFDSPLLSIINSLTMVNVHCNYGGIHWNPYIKPGSSCFLLPRK